MMTSALQRIVFRTGSRKAQFISSRFDLATLCLTSSASNGNRIARCGCDFIRHHGMPKPNANIRSVAPVRLSAGLMQGTARAYCDVRTVRELFQKQCVTLTVTESRK